MLIDTNEKKIQELPLPTFYYDSIIVDILPGEEQRAKDRIDSWYKKRKNDDCELEITVRGFVNLLPISAIA